MSDNTTITRNGPDSWPDTCTPSALGSIEASSGPVPRVSLRDDVDANATTVKVAPSSQGRSSPIGPGRYAILGEIARGGMGAVLRGHDADLNRDLAIKVLLEKYAENVEVLGRFIEEAQIGGQLQHPGIVPVYELGQFPDKRPFFAMKLVKGRTLAELLKERASPIDNLPRFLKIFEQICETMAYAHSKGVIHRDLKPLNVMVGAFGEVQVMDWGLAKILDRKDDPEALKTQPQASVIRTERSETGLNPTIYGDLMGTAAYMPPEQARGEIDRLDERTDVFALGSILCEVLTGKPAYTGRTPQEIIDRAKIADLADARTRLDACGCESDLIAIATACLAPIADDRPRNASEVAGLVTAYLSGVQEKLRKSEIAKAEADAKAEAESARAESEKAQAQVERTRRKLAMALAGGVLLAVTIGGGSWMAFRLDKDARLAESDQIVGEALAAAKALKGEAETAGLEAVDAWGRALDAANTAKKLATARPPRASLAEDVAKTYDSVAKLATDVHERLRQLEADRRLVTALDEARLQGAALRDDHFDTHAKLAAYAAAFRQSGIDLDRPQREKLIAILMAKRDLARIAAALDDWTDEEDDQGRRAILAALAESIDPDRNELRAAIRANDRSKLLAIAHSPGAGQMPASTADLLARILNRLDEREEAIALLKAARGSAPADFWINHNLGLLLSQNSKAADLSEAVRYLTAAAVLKPDSPAALLNLGSVQRNQGKWNEAITTFQGMIHLDPKSAVAHAWLANILRNAGRLEAAVAEAKDAIRLQPDYLWGHEMLAWTYLGQRKWDEAVTECQWTIRKNPNLSGPHNLLGMSLRDAGRIDEAVAAFREALRLEPGYVEAMDNLGSMLISQSKLKQSITNDAITTYQTLILSNPKNPVAHAWLANVLLRIGRLDEAVAQAKESVRLQPDYVWGHETLAWSYEGQGKWNEAIAEYRAAIRLKPDNAGVHYNLGLVLGSQGKLDEAISAYRAAIRLKPEFAQAHCNLGHALRSRGRFSDALAELVKGHELGSKQPGWRYPSAQWVKDCEAFVALEVRIPALLRGDERPRDTVDGLALGHLCYDTKRFAASARFWGDALADDPKLGNDRKAGHRYNAACSAAMAGNGEGNDDPKPDDAARAKLRDQARDWLRAELSAWKKVAMTAEPGNKPLVAKTLQHWKADAALAGVRDADGLAKLPEPERAEWIKLWDEVDALLAKVAK